MGSLSGIGGFLLLLLLPLAVLHDTLPLVYRIGLLQFMVGMGVGAYLRKQADDHSLGLADFDGLAWKDYTHPMLHSMVASFIGPQTLETAQAISRSLRPTVQSCRRSEKSFTFSFAPACLLTCPRRDDLI